MFRLKSILLFLHIVCILTIIASDERKTAGITEKSTTNNLDRVTDKKEQNVSDEDVKANYTSISYAEGGLIINSQSTELPLSNHKDEVEQVMEGQSLTVKKDLDSPIVNKRKENLIQDQPTANNNMTSTVNNSDNTSETILNTKVVNRVSSIDNETIATIATTTSTITTTISTIATTSTVATITSTTTTSSSTTKMHSMKTPKPKPTATIGTNKPSHTSSMEPSLDRSRKIDYIIPVAITVVALPIVSAIGFILYTRGRDCWDKRHYRRMDFLIDGMYND